MKKSVLFLCTGNSCRSQMAEGWCRHLHHERIESFSAGTAPHGIDPRAMAVMKEVGVDLSSHESTHVQIYMDRRFDLVVTVCDDARESCPVPPPHDLLVHHRFDDPPRLAREAASDEQVLAAYRRVRDEIREFVAGIPARLAESS